LRDAAADAVPATSSEVPLLECSASTMPFVATVPLLVVAFKPPAPVRLAEGAGFCAVAEAEGAALGLTFGLAACAWAAVLIAVLAAVLVVALATGLAAVAVVALVAVLAALDVALEAALFEAATVDSVEPATLAAAAVPVFEAAAADCAAASPVTDPCFTAVVAGCSFGLSRDPPTAP
jgi:hypothetical protein